MTDHLHQLAQNLIFRARLERDLDSVDREQVGEQQKPRLQPFQSA
jgi:hypothetical protein